MKKMGAEKRLRMAVAAALTLGVLSTGGGQVFAPDDPTGPGGAGAGGARGQEPRGGEVRAQR